MTDSSVGYISAWHITILLLMAITATKTITVRVEFSLGAGVYSRHYDKFHNTPRTKVGLMIESIKKTYWGIDQAAVSFSYSFDLKKKGGKR